MEKIEYPKVIYKSGESKVVRSKEEHDEHGEDWKESPAEVEGDSEQSDPAPAKAKKSGKSKKEPVAE